MDTLLNRLKIEILTSIQADGGISGGIDEEQFEAMLDEAIFEETHTTLKLYLAGGNNPSVHIKIDNVEATPENGIYTFNDITVNEWHDMVITNEEYDVDLDGYLGNYDNHKDYITDNIQKTDNAYKIYVDKNHNEYFILYRTKSTTTK